jgi:long-chain acyl-CoA synthetase
MTTTIPRLFLHLTDTFQKSALLLYKKGGRYLSLSTTEVRQEVERIALGLKDLGVNPGDKVVLLAENGPWWVMTDYAILGLGAVTVPIYTSLVPDQIKYIISDSDSKVVIVSDRKLWDKVAEIRGDLPGIKHFVSFEDRPAGSILSLAELEAKGEKSRQAVPSLFEDAAERRACRKASCSLMPISPAMSRRWRRSSRSATGIRTSPSCLSPTSSSVW